jgi:hypothetical protein
MTTDPDLGQALEEIAARAPDPSALQARLAGRVRAHRQRRAILATAAVLGAGAAAGVPAAVALRRGPARPTGPDLTPALPSPTVTRAPLGLRATWIPEGLVAQSRGGSVDGLDSEQTWSTPQNNALRLTGISPPPPAVTLSARRFLPTAAERSSSPYFPLPAKANTTVGGRPAVSVHPGTLQWVIAEDVLATVQAALPTEVYPDLRRVAESTVYDDRAVCEVAPTRAGWLPTFSDMFRELPPQQQQELRQLLQQRQVRIDMWGTGTDWVQRVNYWPVVVTLAHIPSAADIFGVLDEPGLRFIPFEETTLRGRPGRVRYLRGGSGVETQFEALFDLPDGRIAQVKSYFPFDDPDTLRTNTIRVAEQLSIGPDPDLRWLGRSVP